MGFRSFLHALFGGKYPKPPEPMKTEIPEWATARKERDRPIGVAHYTPPGGQRVSRPFTPGRVMPTTTRHDPYRDDDAAMNAALLYGIYGGGGEVSSDDACRPSSSPSYDSGSSSSYDSGSSSSYDSGSSSSYDSGSSSSYDSGSSSSGGGSCD